MYLHIGQNELVAEGRIIGVFDLDKCTAGKRGREFLERAEKNGEILDSSGELPLSFVLCDHPYHPQIVCLSQLTAAALKRRHESRSRRRRQMQKTEQGLDTERRGKRYGTGGESGSDAHTARRSPRRDRAE